MLFQTKPLGLIDRHRWHNGIFFCTEFHNQQAICAIIFQYDFEFHLHFNAITFCSFCVIYFFLFSSQNSSINLKIHNFYFFFFWSLSLNLPDKGEWTPRFRHHVLMWVSSLIIFAVDRLIERLTYFHRHLLTVPRLLFWNLI